MDLCVKKPEESLIWVIHPYRGLVQRETDGKPGDAETVGKPSSCTSSKGCLWRVCQVVSRNYPSNNVERFQFHTIKL